MYVGEFFLNGRGPILLFSFLFSFLFLFNRYLVYVLFFSTKMGVGIFYSRWGILC